MKITNLLNRTSYTFFESILTIDQIINFSKENNIEYVSIVDKNVMYGAMEFYLSAKNNSLKPVIGLEVQYNNETFVVFALNYDGYIKLCNISSALQLKEEIDISEIKKNKNVHLLKSKLKPVVCLDEKEIPAVKLFSRIGHKDIKEVESLHKSKLSKEEIEEIQEIVKKTNIVIPVKKDILPNFKTPNNEKPIDYLEKILKDNFKLFLKNNEVDANLYLERIKFEFSIIKQMNFENYFLIVWDFIKWAKTQNIFIGPGRGSVGGSLISFILNITEVDPIKYNLIFERFLNPERISIPDIDIDIEDERREEVINYIVNKYGIEHVCQIITFQTLRARMSIRDIGREIGIPLPIVDKFSKSTPEFETLKSSYESSKRFKLLIDTNEDYKKIFDNAKHIEGLPRQFSTHAAGIVLSNDPIRNIIPIQRGYGNTFQTQYSMEYMELNGLLKMDLLGLRNLSFLKHTLELIKKNTGKEVNIKNIKMDDKKTFALLSKGKTSGIFQLESPGMTKVITNLSIDSFEDIVSAISLFRPGPQQHIESFIKRKKGKEKIDYIDSSIKEILLPTYGVIIYQEQILQIAQKYSGFSLAKADILRRAIGKKDHRLMESLKKEFIDGANKLERNKATSEKIYQMILEFADYGFNRSHAVAYSILSYQLAYLKANFPLEFIASLLSSISGSQDKIVQYIEEAKDLGIRILLPSVNNSFENFTIEKNAIRFGLLAIKGIGMSLINEMIEDRNKNGKYSDLYDFVIRASHYKSSKKVIELLIKCGALDEFESNRLKLINNIERLLEYASIVSRKSGDSIIIDKKIVPQPKLIDTTENKNNDFELESLGFLLSLETKKAKTTETEIGEEIKVIGDLVSLRKIVTKYGSQMAIANISTEKGRFTLTLWPKKLSDYEKILNIGSKIIVKGKLDTSRPNTIVVSELKEYKNE